MLERFASSRLKQGSSRWRLACVVLRRRPSCVGPGRHGSAQLQQNSRGFHAAAAPPPADAGVCKQHGRPPRAGLAPAARPRALTSRPAARPAGRLAARPAGNQRRLSPAVAHLGGAGGAPPGRAPGEAAEQRAPPLRLRCLRCLGHGIGHGCAPGLRPAFGQPVGTAAACGRSAQLALRRPGRKPWHQAPTTAVSACAAANRAQQ